MKDFKSDYDSIDINDIEEFRKKYKLPKLPVDYANFMVRCNGGTTRYDKFTFEIEGRKEDSIISFFYSISNECDDSDTMNYAMSFPERYPNELIPIACDFLGNSICIGIKGKHIGSVFIWIHDMIDEDDKWANTFLISKYFNEFLDSLTPSGVNEDEKSNELHNICKAGDYKKLKKALNKGISKEELRDLAKICAYLGNLSMIKLLADNGCEMKMLAFTAIKGKQTETALYLLENYEDVNSILPDKSTWLHKAAEFDNYDLAKILIDKGCDLNIKDRRGFTPLSRTSNSRMIKLIKDAGGNF
jgi:hypothetical protein